MKWFRHETDAHTSLKLQTLIQKLGLTGYGYYWFLLELLGKESDKDFRLIPGKNWKKLATFWLNIDEKQQDEWLEILADLKLIDKKAIKTGTLYIPKMKERLDDYTNRVRRLSEQGSDNVPLQDNTIQDNTKQDINKLLNAFRKTINPVINYANMTQRQAAMRLIKAFGLEECIKVVEYIEKHKIDKYLPVITTPLQLEQKYAQLDQYRGKK